MIETTFKCKNINELTNIAKQILDLFPNERIYLISGKMGAGKTTLVKELCKQLKVVDVVNSPTFSIINEYSTEEGQRIFHFDLYRIKSPIELLDIGYEEYIYSGHFCLIEWPEMAIELMPSTYIKIEIAVQEQNEERSISVVKESI